MSNEQNLPDIRFDAANLYQEDVFTDRTAGTIPAGNAMPRAPCCSAARRSC